MALRDERLIALNALRSRVPHLSQRALSAILQIARTEELPRDSRRDTIRAARDQLIQKETPYGRVHQTAVVPLASGGDLNIELPNPQAMLFEIVRSNESFSKMIERGCRAAVARGTVAAHNKRARPPPSCGRV